MKIVPRGVNQGGCVPTTCSMSLDACPTNEVLGLGDLRVIKNGKTVACLGEIWIIMKLFQFSSFLFLSSLQKMELPTTLRIWQLWTWKSWRLFVLPYATHWPRVLQGWSRGHVAICQFDSRNMPHCLQLFLWWWGWPTQLSRRNKLWRHNVSLNKGKDYGTFAQYENLFFALKVWLID